MRRPILVAVVLAVAALVVGAALDERRVAFETGLPAFDLVDVVGPGADVCAREVDVPAGFQRVRLVVGPDRAQPLGVTIRDAAGERVGAGRFAGGEPARGGNVEIEVGDVPAGGRIDVCVTNEGSGEQRIFGSPPNRDATRPPELAVVFVADPAPAMLSLVPDAVERSAVFKPGWYGEWTTWLLAAAVVLLIPLALSRALSAAYASDRSYSRSGIEDRSERSS